MVIHPECLYRLIGHKTIVTLECMTIDLITDTFKYHPISTLLHTEQHLVNLLVMYISIYLKKQSPYSGWN